MWSPESRVMSHFNFIPYTFCVLKYIYIYIIQKKKVPKYIFALLWILRVIETFWNSFMFVLKANSYFHKISSPLGCAFFLQTFYVSIVDLCDNGGKRPITNSSASFTKEQADTIRRIRNSKDSWDMLGVKPGASR